MEDSITFKKCSFTKVDAVNSQRSLRNPFLCSIFINTGFKCIIDLLFYVLSNHQNGPTTTKKQTPKDMDAEDNITTVQSKTVNSEETQTDMTGLHQAGLNQGH